jgi:ubiquitin-conjugating enzyme E2 G1
LICLPHRNLQNGWLIWFVVIVFNFSSNFTLKSGGMGNFFVWNVLLVGPPESPFEGGIFKCQFTFSKDYPNKAPEFKFLSNIPHPNIYPDGKVCISILHEGKDEWGYEDISERWNPSHSVNSVLMSILSMLPNPNFESPANVDISVMWKNKWDEYKKMIYYIVAKSH